MALEIYLEGSGFRTNYWLWIAVDRFRKRFISFVCGTRERGTATGMKLYKELSKIKVGCYCSDHWKSYKEIVESEKHIQSKTETYTVERDNSEI